MITTEITKINNIKDEIYNILNSFDVVLRDNRLSKSNTPNTLSELEYLKDVVLEFRGLLEKYDIKEAIDIFKFYNGDFDKINIEHSDLLAYSLYDELDEVPLDLFYNVRDLYNKVKELFDNIF